MTTRGPGSDPLRRRPPNHAITVADRHGRHHRLVLRRRAWGRLTGVVDWTQAS